MLSVSQQELKKWKCFCVLFLLDLYYLMSTLILKKITILYCTEVNKGRGIGKSPIAATAWHKCCTRFEV